MAPAPRLLLLMRHAEAVAFAPGLGDVDRPLSERGQDQARRAGAYLEEHTIIPGLTLCSGAVRTRQTAELLGVGSPCQADSTLYNAGSDAIREAIGDVDEDVDTLLVVGHAPGVPTLAHALADEATSDDEALTAIRWGFPAATLVGIEIGGTWAQPQPGPVTFTFQG